MPRICSECSGKARGSRRDRSFARSIFTGIICRKGADLSQTRTYCQEMGGQSPTCQCDWGTMNIDCGMWQPFGCVVFFEGLSKPLWLRGEPKRTAMESSPTKRRHHLPFRWQEVWAAWAAWAAACAWAAWAWADLRPPGDSARRRFFILFFRRSAGGRFERVRNGGGGQNRFGMPFWWVGEFTTHFRTYFSGDWDVHWGHGILTQFWGAPPRLVFLVGIGMFTGGTIWILTHGQMAVGQKMYQNGTLVNGTKD